MLVSKQPSRLVGFGCSFTNHLWNYTWPEIVHVELDVPLYNYGKIAAGNQYIFNTIVQADSYYQFNTDDLVMICWSGISREDRYAYDTWHHTANVNNRTPRNYLNDDWVRQYCDPNGMALRDFALFKAADALLQQRGCQYHYMAMNVLLSHEIDSKFVDPFHDVIDKIHPDYSTVLWDTSWEPKREQMRLLNPIVTDLHPSPREHLQYLEHTFDYTFSAYTAQQVLDFHQQWEAAMRTTTDTTIQLKPYNFGQPLLGFI
jgi:hypothetical protein